MFNEGEIMGKLLDSEKSLFCCCLRPMTLSFYLLTLFHIIQYREFCVLQKTAET